MPNLVGIWDRRADPESLAATVTRMVKTVDIPAYPYVKQYGRGQGLAVANLLTRVEDNLNQPAVDASTGVWLMLDGEFRNARPLELELAARGRAGAGAGTGTGAGAVRKADLPRLALEAYLTLGPGFVDKLNGAWNIVVHDPRSEETLICTDRLGSRILFYSEDGGRVTFATEAKAVIAGRAAPTRAGGPGLIELFAGGLYGDLTWLDGIHVLDPGTLLRLSSLGARRQRYWRIRFTDDGPKQSLDDYAVMFAQRLRSATNRCLDRNGEIPIAITLSGGLDSRSVALSIDDAHRPLPSITYGEAEHPDVRYAAQLARILLLNHSHIESERQGLLDASNRTLDALLGERSAGSPRGFLASQVDRVTWRNEGMSNFPGSASMLWHPIYARTMRVMLTGACGDALTGSHLSPRLLLMPNREKLLAATRRGYLPVARERICEVLQPSFVQRHWEGLEESIRGWFRGIECEHPMAVSSVWDMENRQRRGAFATFAMERYFCTLRAPYLDYELAEFLAEVPPRYRFQQRLYKRMLVKQFPQAREVNWAYTEGPITDSFAFEIAREARNFAKSRVKKWLVPKDARKERWHFRDVTSLLRQDGVALAEPIHRWLKSSSFPGDVYNRPGIEALVARFLSGADDGAASQFEHLCQMSRLHLWGVFSGSVPAIPPEGDPSNFGVEVTAPGAAH
jgi:asparagine synthetase B (glutamine-hydrolysing)